MYEELNYVNGHKFPTESPVKDGEFMELKRQRFFFFKPNYTPRLPGWRVKGSVGRLFSLPFPSPLPIPLHCREFSTYTDGR